MSAPLRILFDCRYVRIGRHDGISRFSASLVAALGARHPVTMLVSDERQLAMLPDLPWVLGPSPTSVLEPLVALRLRRHRADVVYTPMQTMGALGRRHALVNTVHDLIYYAHPRPPRDLPAFVRVLWRLYHLSWWPQRLLLHQADAVVAVSRTTADLIRRHRLTRRSVTVVPNAATPPDAPAPGPRERTLVYMGSFMPYKDVDTLARGMRHLPGWTLHLMSRVPDADRARLTALAPDGALVFADGASDEEYASTLRTATALVSASRDEGFGIPLVEAMSHGTPVVVSDIPIFREIGGDAARYFAAGDDVAFARAVESLAGEWEHAAGLAPAQAARFDWGRSADALLEVLTRVVADRR